MSKKTDGRIEYAPALAILSQYIPHEPIIIKQNADFVKLGLPGDGTEENPYTIEGLNITSAFAELGSGLIHIEGISVFVQIRNNLIDGINNEPHAGILLRNVQQGIIENNIVVNCYYGIILGSESNHNVITHNTIANHRADGIAGSWHNYSIITHNTILNCEHTGISIRKTHYDTISYNTVSNCTHGISLRGSTIGDSTQNMVSQNIISNNKQFGISLDCSGQNTIHENQLIENGLYIDGFDVRHFIQTSVQNNFINGHPLIFWQDKIGGTVPSGAGQVILVNVTNVEVVNQSISYSVTGVTAAYSSNVTIHHNTISNNIYGLFLLKLEKSTISHNTISNNSLFGVWLEWSTHNILFQNTINDNVRRLVWGDYPTTALMLYYSDENTIAQNNVTNNHCVGITLYESTENIVTDNCANNNTSYGIFLYKSPYNTLLRNQLTNNSVFISGYGIEDFLQTEVINNTVNGQPLVYWQNIKGGTVPVGAGQIILVNTVGVEVTNQSLSRLFDGILVLYSSKAFIHHNILFNNQDGIYLWETNHTTVSHNNLFNNTIGIHLFYAQENTIFHNTISNNSNSGIKLYESKGNTLVGNNLINNGLSISGWSKSANMFYQADVVNNTINGRPLVYWQDIEGGTVPPDAGQVILIDVKGVEVTGQVLTGVSSLTASNLEVAAASVFVAFGENVSIHHNAIFNNGLGITLYTSTNSTLSNNTVLNNTIGIYLTSSEYISKEEPGEYNTVSVNTVICNKYGIILAQGGHNTIASNIFANNSYEAITLWNSNNNTVIENDFLSNNLGNESQIQDWGHWNVFVSNYWDDHNNRDQNGDGVADTPYVISRLSQDPTPLTAPINSAIETTLETPSYISRTTETINNTSIIKLPVSFTFSISTAVITIGISFLIVILVIERRKSYKL